MRSSKLLIIPLFLFTISGFFLWKGFTPEVSNQYHTGSENGVLGEQIKGEKAKVLRVIDGDTIEVDLNGVDEKVRYIGMDTPETVDPNRPVGCFGHEASDENKKLVEGREVILTKDTSERDKFGRLLRFVYVGNLFVNDYLTREGFARVLTEPPDVKLANEFADAQVEAQSKNLGLWSACK